MATCIGSKRCENRLLAIQ